MLRPKLAFRMFLLLTLLLLSIFVLSRSVEGANGSVNISYYANDYNIFDGTYLSGGFPSCVIGVDADYLIVRSVDTDTSMNRYNPAGYMLLGSTSWVLGSVSNLTSNDDSHMVFSSYFSGSDIEDYVDNNASNVDSTSDKGAHSNFTTQQYAPDSVYDTLTEQSAGNLIIRPSAVGQKSDWNPVGSTSNWECVDEVTPDEDTTLVNITSKNRKDFYNLQNRTMETGPISNVRLHVRAKGNVSAELTPTLVVSTVEYPGQTYTLTTSYAEYFDDWATNPAGGNWTWSDIDALQAGFRSSTAADVEHRVTQLYLNVTFMRYELDLEVQWTNVDYDETNEQLCIYGGTMGAENIRVDVWNGSDWENLFPDLNSAWNNVSVSSYLDTSTFTIRFKGGTETSDTTQNTWNIDATLLHLETDQHTAEVEFTGLSNTYSWEQLNWAFDSAWTIASVSVSIQLYNYTLGDYPTSGNGLISYTSSATADTNETKTQTTTTSPQHFRDASGNWRIKVKGVKTTTSQFDLKVDWVEFEPTHYSEYKASTEFIFSSLTTNTPAQLNFTVVSQYSTANVNVTIQIWNYSSSAYATSGQAHLEYTSRGTNETKTLNITNNPQFYTSNRTAKLKITGLQATAQYRQEVNHIELVYAYVEMPPVASFAYMPIDPTANETVTFNASNSFDPNANIVNYTWNFGDGNITTVLVSTVTHTYATHGNFTVSLTLQDSEGLTDVETKTIIVNPPTSPPQFNWLTALLFASPFFSGLLLLLVLKHKSKETKASLKPILPPKSSLEEPEPRKKDSAKKTDVFSSQFGKTHRQIIGKKMLLEINPKSDHQRTLSNFISETKNNDELLFIETNRNSALHSAFSGTDNVKFLLLTPKTSTPRQKSEMEALLPARDLSVLLDVCAGIQKVETKKTINFLFDDLSGLILRCGFQKTRKFMSQLLEVISSPKTTALFVFTPTAHNSAISSSIRDMFQIRLVRPKRTSKVKTS